jgi:hypothetical protein
MSGVAGDDRPQAADDAVGLLWAEATGQANGAPAIAMLDPRQVVVPERLRPEDPAHTAALIESVRQHGVRLPIEVRILDGRPVLIAGLHRVRAAIAAERKTVPAIIREWGCLRATIDHEVERIERWCAAMKRHEPDRDIANQQSHLATLRALQSTITATWERRFLAPARRAEARNGDR